MRRPTFASRRSGFVFAAALGLFAAAGCSEREGEALSGARAQAEAQAASPIPDSWLAVDERVPPAVFFAEAVGGEASELGPPLERLAAHYRESPRMIANRLVQLWPSLHAEDPALTPARLIADFTPEAESAAGPMESLGPAIQHYRVLRGQGADHRTAVAAALGKAPP